MKRKFIHKKNKVQELLLTDVHELNKFVLLVIGVAIILVAGLTSYKLTNGAYALFSDEVEVNDTLELTVCNNDRISDIDTSGANLPVLDSGMIPVYYDKCKDVWRKADVTNQDKWHRWYNYDEQVWANSVTVSIDSRDYYLNSRVGTPIDMADILTMQVWIPRYKYKVWNYNSAGTTTSATRSIDIVFESETSSTGTITCTDSISGTSGAKSQTCKIGSTTCTNSVCNSNYYTHPAFTFGTEQIPGFWIGKFEMTGTISNITTKPNVTTVRNQKVGAFATNIMKMNDSGNVYGFSTGTDTHMIKNIEWGAVAYLSHSKYGTCSDGTCSEVYINNCSSYITGIGAGTAGAASSSTTCTTDINKYNGATGKNASTTKNIYGVYDMSGGSREYVMGNVVSKNGSTMLSGDTTTANSGYTGIIYNDAKYTSYSGSYSYPNAKYYDKYSFGNDSNELVRGKLGDAIKEVLWSSGSSWYSDYSNVAYSYNPWWNRGGNYNNGANAGIFTSSANYGGGANAGYTSRVIITP